MKLPSDCNEWLVLLDSVWLCFPVQSGLVFWATLRGYPARLTSSIFLCLIKPTITSLPASVLRILLDILFNDTKYKPLTLWLEKQGLCDVGLGSSGKCFLGQPVYFGV